MSNHSFNKKRKLDHRDTNVLFKPFKSPLKVASPEDKTDTKSTSATENTTLETEPPPQEGDNPSADPNPAPQWTLPRRQTFNIKNKAPTQAPVSELTLLRREESRLLAQLSKLKIERDQIQQAAGIEKSGEDAELRALITHWKAASQQAAEEVYATFRDKVNASGGLRCWREAQKARMQNSFAFESWEETKGTRDADGGGDGGENREDEDGEREDDGHEYEHQGADYDHGQGGQQDPNEDGESFSMDIMLRYLGIALDVIGYDDQEHRWLT